MLKIDIISVQPQMFKGFLEESILARAVKKGCCEIRIIDLKAYGLGRWKKTDDKPYGGGPGMLMRCEPWFAAVEAACGGAEAMRQARESGKLRVIMTSPKGCKFSQRDAEWFAGQAEIDHLVIMCGHYEGFDARIETLATDFLSIGDFIMTGGELAAAAMTDAIVRLIPGVLGGGPAATASESFGADGRLEAPQYTHPPEFRGLQVPATLLSGDHRKIESWRQAESIKLTRALRPDLPC